MANSPDTSPIQLAGLPEPPVAIPMAGAPASADSTPDVSSLLKSLEEVAAESGHSSVAPQVDPLETKLIDARLGIASGLHAAMRCKHPPTASHSLRVALACSSWATEIKLSDDERDALEVAAMLHDVGKIGVPDKALLKPGRLSQEEAELMARHTAMSIEVLAACGAPVDVLEIVRYAHTRYDGASLGSDRAGDSIPIAARMLGIVDAFDSMTTDHVYRPARSRERALAELFRCAGSQFDPKLVQSFSELFAKDQNLLTEKLSRHWLRRLSEQGAVLPWNTVTYATPPPAPATDSPATVPLFASKLIDNMHDGVLFVDINSTIMMWNTGAERLTGVSSDAAAGRTFLPSLLGMSNSRSQDIPDEDCPVARAITTGVQSIGRVAIMGRQGRPITVDIHTVPVRRGDGVTQGATVLLHDATSESSLEAKCQALHAQVVKDPLTQVANRAEFDRMLVNFVAAHQESNLPCSLIMSDIDHFKSINDTFGHQAGDAAIISFASLLKSMCRSGDLVARYGGEEFVMLCADCSNASAVRKAESVRKQIMSLEHSYLGNHRLKASFGVTELQAGDTPETMLRRADRALLQAKDQGRNQVVQLGSGMTEEKSWGFSWWPFKSWGGGALVETTLVSAVPLDVLIPKLRGFIADHDAKITHTSEDSLRMEVSDRLADINRRAGDRVVTFAIAVHFKQQYVEHVNFRGSPSGKSVETRIGVTIRPRHNRDRRRDMTVAKARRLLGGLKSYLMANEDDADPSSPGAISADVPAVE